MKKIRQLRLHLERNKSNTKVNLLWFLAGIAIVPGISGIFGTLQKLSNGQLSALATLESVLLVLLLIASAILVDKITIANKYIEGNKTTWEEVEAESEYEGKFEEAAKQKDK